MPAPKLKGYARETVIAEKFHVMVNRGLLNSRMKDFYDIWLLSNHFDFNQKELKDAIRELSALPALVFAGETRALKNDLAKELSLLESYSNK